MVFLDLLFDEETADWKETECVDIKLFCEFACRENSSIPNGLVFGLKNSDSVLLFEQETNEIESPEDDEDVNLVFSRL